MKFIVYVRDGHCGCSRREPKKKSLATPLDVDKGKVVAVMSTTP